MENLWEKELCEGSTSYVDIFDDIKTESVSSGHGLSKNDLISTQLREKGNQKFKDSLWIDAMDYYNKSLRFAAIGTKNMSFVYANRAACFLHLKMFDKCLIDIEMAKEGNYPKELLPKLEKREADCLKMMKREKQEHLLERKLSFEANANFPCLANVVEIQWNDEFGRHVIAKCDLPAGKTILVEKSFLSTTLSGPFIGCATCQRTTMNFIACDHSMMSLLDSTIAVFCDDHCKQAGLHKYDCNFVYDRNQANDSQLRMMAQTIFFGMDAMENIDEMIQFVEETERIKSSWTPDSIVDAKSKYRLFLTLAAFPDENEKKSLVVKAKSLYGILIGIPTVNGVFNTTEKQQFLKHLVTKHVVIASQNAINATQNQCQRIATLGLIFPLFNHECAPNLLNFSIGDQQVCITMRPVKKGGQLFVSYVTADVSTRLRQTHLMNNFGFLCKCDKCELKSSTLAAKKLLADPLYLFLQRNRKVDLLNDTIRANIKEKCIDLLNKHGQTWFPELEFVVDLYVKSELYEH
ncbi:SET and MYND domain-containing protein DDB_G0273589-like [Sitodiplosis mosellana]|uniref:SET and MYND domain-containing protein DDB_G0273589-like n=1 Tax=Sitodiplosis mosellana TaxID=263140 RepID=UPI002444EE86|nr:SET and MYND domain-containing protein DDB_G0273589-like [Sitodiplosis mosellana]